MSRRAAHVTARFFDRRREPALTHPWLANLRNDITGGVISAGLAIPLAIGYGMFAFVPLGDAYFAAEYSRILDRR